MIVLAACTRSGHSCLATARMQQRRCETEGETARVGWLRAASVPRTWIPACPMWIEITSRISVVLGVGCATKKAAEKGERWEQRRRCEWLGGCRVRCASTKRRELVCLCYSCLYEIHVLMT